MKIVSVWNPKGGQGKTMLSINIAAAAVELDLKPLVICRDPQGTATLYSNAGNLPYPVIQQIPQEAPDVDLVIFDHPAEDWNVPPAKLLVMPVIPRRDQYATYVEAFEKASAAGKEIITVVTGGDTRRTSERRIVQALRQRGAFVIKDSSAIVNAAEGYLHVFHPTLNREYEINERRGEFQAILSAVLRDVNKKHEEVKHVAQAG